MFGLQKMEEEEEEMGGERKRGRGGRGRERKRQKNIVAFRWLDIYWKKPETFGRHLEVAESPTVLGTC